MGLASAPGTPSTPTAHAAALLGSSRAALCLLDNEAPPRELRSLMELDGGAGV